MSMSYLCYEYEVIMNIITALKMKFSIKDFFSKCDLIRQKQQIWLHLLKNSLMENFIFFVQWILTTFSNLPAITKGFSIMVFFPNAFIFLL